MNSYYRSKITGFISRISDKLLENYIDYKIYRSVFGIVIEYDRYRIIIDPDCKYYRLEMLDEGLKLQKCYNFTDVIDFGNTVDYTFYQIIERRFKGSYWEELMGMSKIINYRLHRPWLREFTETKKLVEGKDNE